MRLRVNQLSAWCGKHATLCDPSTDILCGVENMRLCVNQLSVWCGKHATLCDTSTDILCDVENMRLCVIRQQTFCVMWKTCDTVWYVNRHSVWCGKLSHKNTLRKHDIDIIMYCGKLTVENLYVSSIWFDFFVYNLLLSFFFLYFYS